MTQNEETIRTTLDNGLRVIVQPRRQAPIGSFWIWYRVGGRNEVPGVTGVSHWAEHMQFKGTERLARGEIFRSITAAGGSLNGFTWLDYTAYLETLPIDQIDLALRIEADRMEHSRFDADEVTSERTVIISERQGNENQPTFLLQEEVAAAAFKIHPYGHGVIGYPSDLRAITRDDLYNHYRTYYRPNNAVVVFVGDLDAQDALQRIEAAFGNQKRGPEIAEVRSEEPQQYGERRVTVNRPAPNRVISMVHLGVPASHPDAPTFIVLDAVLSGGKPMGFGGGAAMGRSSRLYRALVAKGFSSSAGSSFSLSIDPYVFGTSATLRPDSDQQRVESIIVSELERLAAEPVPDDVLERVRKQIRAQWSYSQQSVSSRAYLLGQLAVVAPDLTPELLHDALLAVTPDDIQRVAAQYLKPDRRTVGWLIPPVPAATAAPDHASLAQAADYVPDSHDLGLDTSMPVVRASSLPNGLRVLTLDDSRDEPEGPVSIRLRIPGGSALDDDKSGVARFTAEMITRGSNGRALEQLAEELDGLGASIAASASREWTEVTATCLREDLDHVLTLLEAAVTRADFPDDQTQIVRAQLLSALRQSENDTRAESELGLRRLLYPEGHPYRERVGGPRESIEAIQHNDLVAYRDRAYRPSNAVVAIAGSIDHGAAVEALERHFGSWAGDTPRLVIPDVAEPPAEERYNGMISGKSQADLAIGTLGLARSNPDYYALTVANHILGRLGLMGRLGESVRERQGMAYYAFSSLETGTGVGFWSARAGVDPANVERAIETILTELRGYLDGGPTEQEYADAIGNLTGSLPMALETVGSVTAVLADIAFYELGLDYLQCYRGIIRALTPQRLIETMRKYVDPERLAISVVGPDPG